jgi:hypothetical protein
LRKNGPHGTAPYGRGSVGWCRSEANSTAGLSRDCEGAVTAARIVEYRSPEKPRGAGDLVACHLADCKKPGGRQDRPPHSRPPCFSSPLGRRPRRRALTVAAWNGACGLLSFRPADPEAST